MIAYLTGMVLERESGTLIVEAGGVGYRVAVAPGVWEAARAGEQVQLRIYHQVSADAEGLYGFATKEDLHYFELLLTVPSVGPRTALAILTVASGATLAQAVAEEDVTILTKVSGVGKKTAERILVELKGKLTAPGEGGTAGALQQEVLEALVSIGYTTSQAREAVQKLPRGLTTVEEAVKAVLQSQRVSA